MIADNDANTENSTERQSTEEIIETLREAAGERVRVSGDGGRVVEARVEVIESDEPIAEKRRDAPRGEFEAGLHPEDLDDEIEDYGVGGGVRVTERTRGGWRRPRLGWETFEDGELSGLDGFAVECVGVVGDGE